MASCQTHLSVIREACHYRVRRRTVPDGTQAVTFSRGNLKLRLHESRRSALRPVFTRSCPSQEWISILGKTFTLRRTNPVLVVPAEPTPYEFIPLSDIDGQDSLRFYADVIYLFNSDTSKEGQDPATVVRDALAKALVYDYPIAGRLREMAGRKLVVQCTGEGVVFVEAEADVRVEDFGATPAFPIPGARQLLYGAEGFGQEILDKPLLYIQVTRFKCGGFALGIEVCHAIADAPGIIQFLKTVADLACSASVLPLPVSGCSKSHLDYDHELETRNDIAIAGGEMLNCSFFFGPKQLLALRKHLPLHMCAGATNFELITAAVWQSRAIALDLDYPSDIEIRLFLVVNTCFKRKIPKGYYGNCVVSVARATASKLKERPLGYALQLVRRAEEMATDGFLQSAMDHFVETRTYIVSDLTRVGFEEVDFGWGRGVYGGIATAHAETRSYYMKGRNERGEEGVVVPISLPEVAMHRFVAEIEGLMEEPHSFFM